MLDGASSTEIAAGVGATVAGIALMFRRVQALWSKDSTEIKASSASQSIITMMRTEMERMSSINTQLAERLNAFQTENIELKNKLGDLTSQVDKFQRENTELRGEITDLRAQLKTLTDLLREWDSKCKDCTFKKVIGSISHDSPSDGDGS